VTGAQDCHGWVFETGSDIPLQERNAAAKSISFDAHIIQMYTFSALSVSIKHQPPTSRRFYFTEPAVPQVYMFVTSHVLANTC
jgi:hypothetical protein